MPLTSLSLERASSYDLFQPDPPFSDSALEPLQFMPLERLNLSHWVWESPQGLALLRGFLMLTSLDLTGCQGLADADLDVLCGIPLTELSLGCCR